MPSPSKVLTDLPDDVRKELDSKLIANQFSDYVGLSQWLESQGFTISKSSLNRYGQSFEKRLQAVKLSTEMAKTLVENVPDDADAMSEALTRMAQDRLFSLLVNMHIDADDISVAQLMKAVSELTKASTLNKRFSQDIKRKLADAAKASEAIAKRGGLSDADWAAIRANFLGIEIAS